MATNDLVQRLTMPLIVAPRLKSLLALSDGLEYRGGIPTFERRVKDSDSPAGQLG